MNKVESIVVASVTCIRDDCRYTWLPRRAGVPQSCPRCKARQQPIAPRRKPKGK